MVVLFAAVTDIAATSHHRQRFTVLVIINDATVVVIVLSVALVVLAEPDRAEPLATRRRGYVPGRDSDATTLRTR